MPNDDQPEHPINPLEAMMQSAIVGHNLNHLRSDVAYQIREACTAELIIEYTTARIRAQEFDWAFEKPGTVTTLEMAAAGYSRHRIATWLAARIAKSSTEPAIRAEYEAKALEHKAQNVRWRIKLTEAVAMKERIEAVVKRGSA